MRAQRPSAFASRYSARANVGLSRTQAATAEGSASLDDGSLRAIRRGVRFSKGVPVAQATGGSSQWRSLPHASCLIARILWQGVSERFVCQTSSHITAKRGERHHGRNGSGECDEPNNHSASGRKVRPVPLQEIGESREEPGERRYYQPNSVFCCVASLYLLWG
jgi:hypothetical protein